MQQQCHQQCEQAESDGGTKEGREVPREDERMKRKEEERVMVLFVALFLPHSLPPSLSFFLLSIHPESISVCESEGEEQNIKQGSRDARDTQSVPAHRAGGSRRTKRRRGGSNSSAPQSAPETQAPEPVWKFEESKVNEINLQK